MHISRLHCCISVVAALILAGSASAKPQAPLPHLDPESRTVWSSSELAIRFTYPGVWKADTPIQATTNISLAWRLKQSKTLLATCYVESHSQGESAVAKLAATDLHRNGRSIAESLVQNMRLRAPDATLVAWRNTVQDGHPVVYTVREGTIQTLDRKHRLKLYALSTAWRGREINLECGTPIFGPDYTSLERGAELIQQVEDGILNLMRTLQFDRDSAK